MIVRSSTACNLGCLDTWKNTITLNVSSSLEKKIVVVELDDVW